jgi:hypothetical protein
MVHKKTRRYRRKTKKNKQKRLRGGNHTPDESACIFVSACGILKSCSIHSSNHTASATTLEGYDFSKVIDRSTVYITGSAIPAFVKVLDTLPGKIILVSGGCDESIPDAILSTEDFKKFIESDKIIHWFSQNCVGKHPKLSQVPIGLAYHVIPRPLEQEAELVKIKNNSKAFYERNIKCYGNFHFTEGMYPGQDRKDAKEKIPADCIYYEPSRKDKYETFKNQTEYAFVVSPHGNGLDCHRTWEALCLGCIPIVKTSVLDPLYEDLPVLIVKDWSDVNNTLLTKTVGDFKNKKFNYDKLTLKYWMEKIKSA